MPINSEYSTNWTPPIIHHSSLYSINHLQMIMKYFIAGAVIMSGCFGELLQSRPSMTRRRIRVRRDVVLYTVAQDKLWSRMCHTMRATTRTPTPVRYDDLHLLLVLMFFGYLSWHFSTFIHFATTATATAAACLLQPILTCCWICAHFFLIKMLNVLIHALISIGIEWCRAPFLVSGPKRRMCLAVAVECTY